MGLDNVMPELTIERDVDLAMNKNETIVSFCDQAIVFDEGLCHCVVKFAGAANPIEERRASIVNQDHFLQPELLWEEYHCLIVALALIVVRLA